MVSGQRRSGQSERLRRHNRRTAHCRIDGVADEELLLQVAVIVMTADEPSDQVCSDDELRESYSGGGTKDGRLHVVVLAVELVPPAIGGHRPHEGQWRRHLGPEIGQHVRNPRLHRFHWAKLLEREEKTEKGVMEFVAGSVESHTALTGEGVDEFGLACLLTPLCKRCLGHPDEALG